MKSLKSKMIQLIIMKMKNLIMKKLLLLTLPSLLI